MRRNPEHFEWLQWGRGLAKSVVGDCNIPLWLWINGGIHFMIAICRNETLACELLDDIKLNFEGNELLRHDFGDQVSHGHWESGNFVTKNGVKFKGYGMGQEVRGTRHGRYRPDYIFFDDPEDRFYIESPARQQQISTWFRTAVFPTMDGAIKHILLGQNRFHEPIIMDLITDGAGYTINRVDSFDEATLKPVWPEKYPPDHFKPFVINMTLPLALSEFCNTPHIEGEIFKDEHFVYGKLPRTFKMIVGHWDPAWSDSKNADYNAVTVVGLDNSDRFWLIDCFCAKSTIEGPIAWMIDYQKRQPNHLQCAFQYESQSNNRPIKKAIKEANKLAGVTLNIRDEAKSTVNKYIRITTLAPHFQTHRMIFSEKLKLNKGFQVGRTLLKGIKPKYKCKDDFPDALEYAVRALDAFADVPSHGYAVPHQEDNSY